MIVHRADAALYASKGAGRNCCHWHDGKKIALITEDGKKAGRPLRDTRQAAATSPKTAVPSKPAACRSSRQGRPTRARRETLADDLPALLNRTAFCQQVRTRMAEWKRGGPTLALVLVEIDDFTTHTRTYGPKVRDLLVVSLARIVFAEVREMDMVARYNTVCLGFLLPDAKLADAFRVAERIREAASRSTFAFNGTHLGYTVSAGLISAGRRGGHGVDVPQGGIGPRGRASARRQLPLPPRRPATATGRGRSGRRVGNA